MIRIGIDLQLTNLCVAELRLWEHALNGSSDCLIRLALEQVAEDLHAVTTWLARVGVVLLRKESVAGDNQLRGVDHDHEVA